MNEYILAVVSLGFAVQVVQGIKYWLFLRFLLHIVHSDGVDGAEKFKEVRPAPTPFPSWMVPSPRPSPVEESVPDRSGSTDDTPEDRPC